MAPDGNSKDHVAVLRQKAAQWAKNITQSQANQDEIWTAIHRTIPFALCYSLPAITLSEDECKYFMAPITKTGLPLAGVSATIPSVVSHAPNTF